MFKTANTGNKKRKKIKESNISDVVDGLYRLCIVNSMQMKSNGYKFFASLLIAMRNWKSLLRGWKENLYKIFFCK